MIEERGNQPTLDQPATYQIKVPGVIDLLQADWASRMAITVEGERYPITIITGEVDQAALHGILRRLYTMGIPLISVRWVEEDSSKTVAHTHD